METSEYRHTFYCLQENVTIVCRYSKVFLGQIVVKSELGWLKSSKLSFYLRNFQKYGPHYFFTTPILDFCWSNKDNVELSWMPNSTSSAISGGHAWRMWWFSKPTTRDRKCHVISVVTISNKNTANMNYSLWALWGLREFLRGVYYKYRWDDSITTKALNTHLHLTIKW